MPDVSNYDNDEPGKLFVGGLSWETSQDNLQRYFMNYGEVVDCVVMKNIDSGRSRGFGFVTFSDPKDVNSVLENGPHTLDGRTIDPKPCNPRNLQKQRHSSGYPKVFLGGLPQNITESELKSIFSRYGPVTEIVIMYDQEKKKSRGFGFLGFSDLESVDRCVREHYITIKGKQVELKKAEPRNGHYSNFNLNSNSTYSIQDSGKLVFNSQATLAMILSPNHPITTPSMNIETTDLLSQTLVQSFQNLSLHSSMASVPQLQLPPHASSSQPQSSSTFSNWPAAVAAAAAAAAAASSQHNLQHHLHHHQHQHQHQHDHQYNGHVSQVPPQISQIPAVSSSSSIHPSSTVQHLTTFQPTLTPPHWSNPYSPQIIYNNGSAVAAAAAAAATLNANNLWNFSTSSNQAMNSFSNQILLKNALFPNYDTLGMMTTTNGFQQASPLIQSNAHHTYVTYDKPVNEIRDAGSKVNTA